MSLFIPYRIAAIHIESKR